MVTKTLAERVDIRYDELLVAADLEIMQARLMAEQIVSTKQINKARTIARRYLRYTGD